MNIQKPTLSEIIWVKTDQLTLANLPDFSLPILHIHVAYFNHLHVLREEVFTFQKEKKVGIAQVYRDLKNILI